MGWTMGMSKFIPTVAGRGQGNSKKLAEHEAAVEALLELTKVNGLAWPDVYLIPKNRSQIPQFQIPVRQPQQVNGLLLIEAGHVGNGAAEIYNSRMARNTDVY
jgi:Double-stranded RNA binding motif